MKKYINKILFSGLIVAMASLLMLGVSSCNHTTHVSWVKIDKASATVAVGNSIQLNASVYPEDADDPGVEWSSDNTSVATVDATGKVTGVAAGDATITVASVDGGYTDQCKVTVVVPVTGVSCAESSIILLDGATDTLTVTVSPSDATNKAVEFSSSDPDVATVTQDGIVSGVKAGTATISVVTVDGSFTATVEVKVYFSSNLRLYDVTDSYYIPGDIALKKADTLVVTIQDITDESFKVKAEDITALIASNDVATLTVKSVDGVGVMEIVGKSVGSTTIAITFESERGKFNKTIPLFVTESSSSLPDIPIMPAGKGGHPDAG